MHYFLKFEITDIYPGSSFDDTCISDILLLNMLTDPVSDDERIMKVYRSEGRDFIFFNTDLRSGMVLVDLKSLKEYKELSQGVAMDITLMNISPDKEWVQVDCMFSATGARVEEYPVLYYVRSAKKIGEDILGKTTAM